MQLLRHTLQDASSRNNNQMIISIRRILDTLYKSTSFPFLLLNVKSDWTVSAGRWEMKAHRSKNVYNFCQMLIWHFCNCLIFTEFSGSVQIALARSKFAKKKWEKDWKKDDIRFMISFKQMPNSLNIKTFLIANFESSA